MGLESKKKWYTVKLLFESVHCRTPINVDDDYDLNTKTYEETHVLVKASSLEEAYRIGKEIGKKVEIQYKNLYGETVQCLCIDALDCFEIMDVGEEFKTGIEVYSRFIQVPGTEDRESVINRLFHNKING